MSGVLDCTSPLTDCVIGDEPDADGEQDTAERIVGEQSELSWLRTRARGRTIASRRPRRKSNKEYYAGSAAAASIHG